MKAWVVIRDFGKINTPQGTHCRAYTSEEEARRYRQSCQDDEETKIVVVEI